jgi:hypothetical protein
VCVFIYQKNNLNFIFFIYLFIPLGHLDQELGIGGHIVQLSHKGLGSRTQRVVVIKKSKGRAMNKVLEICPEDKSGNFLIKFLDRPFVLNLVHKAEILQLAMDPKLKQRVCRGNITGRHRVYMMYIVYMM